MGYAPPMPPCLIGSAWEMPSPSVSRRGPAARSARLSGGQLSLILRLVAGSWGHNPLMNKTRQETTTDRQKVNTAGNLHATVAQKSKRITETLTRHPPPPGQITGSTGPRPQLDYPQSITRETAQQTWSPRQPLLPSATWTY